MKRLAATLVLSFAAATLITGQEYSDGISVPVTVTGNALYTNAKQSDYNLAQAETAGFRAVLSPTLKLGPHWFAYSSLDLHSSSYFTGTSYSYDESPVVLNVLQAFLGYTAEFGGTSVLFKGGQLSSAFGLAPIEYNDSKMALLAPPRIYSSRINLRPDQRPCGTLDLLRRRTGSEINFKCGGAGDESYGMTPLTLYGMPGLEAEVSSHRVDFRFEVTNSSPVNPQSLNSDSQFAVWTAGAGYTLAGGLHIGFSTFRGPHLNSIMRSVLPPANSISAFNATGAGTDIQWSRGAWSTEAEWQRYHFDVPGFLVSPTVYAGYAQAKRIISPRTFFATRVTVERFGAVLDSARVAAAHFQPSQNTFELSAGYRLNRHQLLKLGYLFGSSGLPVQFYPELPHFDSTIEMQLVSDFTAFSRAFR